MTTESDAIDGLDVLRIALRKEIPVVGVFGQSAGWSETHPDPILKVALDRAGRDGSNWKSLLATESLAPHFYEWLGERFLRRAPSEALEVIGNSYLSSVFTSSIDPGFANLFATNGREPEAVLLGDPGPPVLRSLRRPPIHYLFGRAGASTPAMRPPPTTVALTQRRVRHAIPMLRNLPEAATAIGLIVIDGYDPDSDWLPPEELLATLGDGTPGGVLWCGAEPKLSGDAAELYRNLRDTDRILRDPRQFPHLMALLSAGQEMPTAGRWDEPEIVTLVGENRLLTTPRLRLSTQVSAMIIDDSWTGFLPPLPPEIEEEHFHAFHGVPSSLRSLTDGVRRGFAINRDFEEALRTKVARALDQHHAQDEAIILHGQSGVGKTIALASLAVSVREKLKSAVLFATGRVPMATEVAGFLEEVDKAEGTTLLIADAMASPLRYDDLLNALRSRGHHVVVVGSSYKLDRSQLTVRPRHIEAPAVLSKRESEALLALTSRFAPNASVQVSTHIENPYALARFYWDLPASRTKLSEGLGREARAVENVLRSRGGRRRPIAAIGQLGKALIDSGYDMPASSIFSNATDSASEVDHAAAKVIDYVMAVSRLYKAVPINLILRVARNEIVGTNEAIDLDVIRELFEGQDLFRWRFADEAGEELLVSARLQVEAQLICNRRLGGPAAEASRIIELIRNAHRAGPEGEEETTFLIDVIYALGPDGPFRDRYRDSYADIARSLTELRERHGVLNARLMLQESTLRRTAARAPNITQEEKSRLLDEASRAVNEAFEAIERNGDQRLYASRRTRDNLWVERAAIYGFLATDSAQRQLHRDEVWASYLAAREAVRKAVSRVDTYFPLDIGLWLPAQILREAPGLDKFQRSELQADVRSVLDLVEPGELDEEQFERFQQQRMRLSEVLSDSVLGEDAFVALDEAGSAAGYYLRARALMPERPEQGEVAGSPDIEGARRTSEYLWSVHGKIASDFRCLNLLLNAEWVAVCGRWLFRGLRQPLPFSLTDRTRIHTVLLDLISSSPDQVQPKYRYLEAVMNWLTNDESASRASWRALARETEYVESGRVLRRHVITDARSEPRIFQGIVDRRLGESRWSVDVPELNRHVDLIEQSFPDVSVAIGRPIRNFTISFNYLGAIADTPTRVQSK